MKQQNINNNILICGIPAQKNENLENIFKSITTSIEAPIQKEEITDIYRKKISSTNSSGMPAPIVIKFNKIQSKKCFMTAKRGKRINTEIINTNMDKRPIYVNDHLTRHKQYLFKCTRDLKRSKKIESTWTTNGDIYVKKTSDSNIIRIYNLEQINEFI